MKKIAVIFGLAALIGCSDPGEFQTLTDGAVTPDGTVNMDSGATDIDSGTDSSVPDSDSGTGADAGTQTDSGVDSGTPSDSGVAGDAGVVTPPVDPACLASDTDTGSYTFWVTQFGTKYPHFNIDGVGDENTVAGCGVTDGVGGYDNGFGTMALTEFGGSPHGIVVPGLDALLSSKYQMASTGMFQVRITHVRADIVTNPNDDCVGIVVNQSWPGTVVPSQMGVGAMVNRRLQGSFSAPLNLRFPTTSNGTIYDFTLYEPVIDITIATNFTGLITVNSYIGGYSFFKATAEDMAAGRDFSGVPSIDALLSSLFTPMQYAQYMAPWLPQYLDIHMNPDGSRNPCSASEPPNAFAMTFRFAK